MRKLPGPPFLRHCRRLFNELCMIYLSCFQYLSLISNSSIMTNCFMIHTLEWISRQLPWYWPYLRWNLPKEIGENSSQGSLVLRVTFINNLLGQVIPWDDIWRIFLYTFLASISEDDILWSSLQVWRIHSVRSLQIPIPCWQPELYLFFKDKVSQSNVLWWENNHLKQFQVWPPALPFLWYVSLGSLFNLWVSISSIIK